MSQTQIGRTVSRTWWALGINGVLAIIVGILVIARPLESVAAFALVIALWALMHGIVRIVQALDLRSLVPHWGIVLVTGIIDVGFGIAALYYYPVLSLSFAIVGMSLWLTVAGFAGIAVAAHERRAGMSWGWDMTRGVLGVVVAIFALLSPPVTLAAIMALIAGYGIVGGVVLLVGAFRLRSSAEKIASTMRGALST
jgi:uncharacterized membrane protein HdeD (DUF308 family)